MAYLSSSAARTAISCRAPNGRFVGLSTFFAVWKQRQVLRQLDARALDDIGISRAAAQKEAARPIWDVPQTWRC